jgi:hypothetical protein
MMSRVAKPRKPRRIPIDHDWVFLGERSGKEQEQEPELTLDEGVIVAGWESVALKRNLLEVYAHLMYAHGHGFCLLGLYPERPQHFEMSILGHVGVVSLECHDEPESEQMGGLSGWEGRSQLFQEVQLDPYPVQQWA